MPPTLVRIAIVCTALVTSAAPVLAQTTDARLSASVAAGLAAPMHADLGFTAPEWQVAVRARISRHVSMEVFFDEWKRGEESTLLDVSFQGSVVGGAQQIRSQTVYTSRLAGWNTLVHGGTRRLTIFGGGGPGFVTFTRRFTQTLTGCTASDPRACNDFSNTHRSSSFAAQLLGGAEFALSSHLAAFGQLQVAVPFQDPGSSHTSTTAGVRVRLW